MQCESRVNKDERGNLAYGPTVRVPHDLRVLLKRVLVHRGFVQQNFTEHYLEMYDEPTIRAYISARRIKTTMTLFGIPTIAWIVLLLCVIARVIWFFARLHASRDWDFKERSMQYLKEKDFDRKRRDIPVPAHLDHELVDR
jgi:hypothetical protein